MITIIAAAMTTVVLASSPSEPGTPELGVHAAFYDEDGRPHTIVGRFPLAAVSELPSAGKEEPLELLLTKVLAATLANEASTFGILPEYVANLDWSRLEFLDDSSFVAFAHPVVDGVGFLDSEISVVGDLQDWEVTGINSISLACLDERMEIVETHPLVGASAAVDFALAAGLLEELDSVYTADGVPEQFEPHANLAWLPNEEVLVWDVSGPRRHHYINATSGLAVDRAIVSGADGAGASVVSISVNSFSAVTADPSDPWSITESTGTTSISLSADYDDISGGNRRYRLQRNYAIQYPIPQILDDGGAYQSEITRTVTAGSTVSFDATKTTGEGDHFRQQETYRWLRKARDYWDGNVFAAVPPLNPIGLNYVTTDLPSLMYCGLPNSSACYSDELHRIEFRSPGVGQTYGARTYVHEYAHHIVNMYGDMSGNCLYGADEGAIIDEALADIFSYIVLGANLGSAYGSVGIDTTKHRSGTSPKVRSYTNCTSGSNPYDPGDYFRQAAWEVLHNFDCQNETPCAVDEVEPPGLRHVWGDDLGWSSQSSARMMVARAFSWAVKVLPQNTTVPAVAFYAYTYLSTHSTAEVASSFRAVMNHHGMGIP